MFEENRMWQNGIPPVKQVSQKINVKNRFSCTLKLLRVSFSAEAQRTESHLFRGNEVQIEVNPNVSDKL
jgi:hypothetical protein